MNATRIATPAWRFDTPSGAPALHEAIAASFTTERPEVIRRLGGFREKDWTRALEWLDVSGIALYFSDHMRRLGADCVLPSSIEGALADRLQRNRVRMERLRQETVALTAWFERAGIRYALLKGMTLVPESVPDIALRSQVDLDFLVADKNRDLAAHYVRRLGYRVHAETRTAIEFRAVGAELPSLASLYSAHAQRALELHIVSNTSADCSLLGRRVLRSVCGMPVYSLGPADILVQQARHLLKHLCGEYTRLSWLLEFRRHVFTRQGDSQLWREAVDIASGQEDGDLAMAMSLWLARNLFGDLPADLRVPVQWQAGALPARVRLWLELYARRILVSHGRPTKIYALLRNEIPSAIPERRSTGAILIPRCLPRRVMDPAPGESVLRRFQRLAADIRFILLRLRFHAFEGFRFGIDNLRWKRAVARVQP